jgi:hypothetical protein
VSSAFDGIGGTFCDTSDSLVVAVIGEGARVLDALLNLEGRIVKLPTCTCRVAERRAIMIDKDIMLLRLVAVVCYLAANLDIL